MSLTEPVHVAGMLNLRVPDMDCPSEEAQIRRALEGYAAIKSMRFDLGARTVAIDAPEADWPAIEQAIAREGLKTERLSAPVSAEETRQRQRREVWKLGAALGFALGAEMVHFAAPETMPWRVLSMALAGVAILLSGFGVYRKGLALLLRGQLSITTLMTVA
ncbi:MAG: cation transporter, partial [Brachymonas sp.]|nr:cation transporter [Brachymonas sp.]